MAELKVKVKVDRQELETLSNTLKKLDNRTVQLKVKGIGDLQKVAENLATYSSNVQKAAKADLDATKAITKHNESIAKYNNSMASRKKAENEVALALEKTKQSENKVAEAIEKTKQASERRAGQEATASAKIRAEEQKTQREYLKSERAINNMTTAWQKMFSAFSASNIVSYAVTRAVSAMRSYFNEALQEMKELDTALTHYRQVTGATQAEAAALGSSAYAVGSKYGTSAADYAESVATYARAGYAGASEALAELSQKTIIVGQTTQEIADQFLLTMDAAYGYKGSVEELSKVLDGASAIDSTYATTIEKIAAGLGLVAPLAQQVHVSEKELTAAIGTITAVTQRSGAESARALRSLFLNILGDTTTEIEDGVTATEESVASLQTVLNKYAKSALDAAKATGQVIDPMEAIGALAESMKQGYLNEAELMDLLSGLGGKLRVSQLVALVSHWDMYNQMIETYSNAMGSADEKTRVYLDSWEAKTNVLKNTWTEFIAKSFNTNVFKGIIDGATKLLQVLGNLGNVIKAVIATVATVKLAQHASSLSKTANATMEAAHASARMAAQLRWQAAELLMAGDAETAFARKTEAARMEEYALEQQAQATAISHQALGFAIATAAVSGVMIAIQAYQKYHADRMQHLKEQRDAAFETARVETQKAQEVADAYKAYQTADSLYQDSKISAEEYETAVYNLATALGVQETAISGNVEALKRLASQQFEQSIKATEDALQIAKNTAKEELEALSLSRFHKSQWVVPEGMENDRNAYIPKLAELAGTKDVEQAVKIYKELLAIQSRYLESSKHDTKYAQYYADAYNDLSNELAYYADILDPVIEKENELNDAIARKEDSTKIEENASATETAGENAEKAAKSFDSLADAIKGAEKALADYQSASKAEKDDTYTAYADAWKKAYEDIQNGMKNSNAVNAALDLFFTPEQLMTMRKRGIEAADVIADDFWSSIFTYTNDKGETAFINDDAGANFAWALYDRFANEAGNIVDVNGDVVASFQDVDGELSVQVESFENLAKALAEVHDTSIDPDVIAAVFEALGMYSTEIQMLPEDILATAQALQAVNDKGAINLETLIQGKIDEGATTQEILKLRDSIIELHGQADSPVKVEVKEGESIDDVKQRVDDLIKNRDELSEKKADVTVTADTKKAESDMEKILFKEKQLEENSPVITVTLEDLASKKLDEIERRRPVVTIRTVMEGQTGSAAGTQMLMDTEASGTKNAPGGLTLVNEQGAEIIAENGTARIAGNGKPTLTWIESGAQIFNATETKAILGGADLHDLYDGINAYAGGNANKITRYQPKDGTASSPASTDTSGTGTAVDTATKDTTTTGKEKDEQLEALKNRINLLKSELDLMEERGDSLDDQIKKQREIQGAYKDEIDYLVSIGGDQTEINKLYKEWYKIDNDIAKLLKDKQVKAYEDKIDLAKSELELLEAQNKPVRQQIEKQRQISKLLLQQANYLKKHGGTQTEINKLLKERKDIEKDIAKLNEGMMDDLSDAVNNKIKKLNATRDKYVDSIQKQIDALKEEKDAQDAANESEEKHQALVEAWRNLKNAQKERTVRQYNAKTGQWEWVADASAVASAKEAYTSAKQDWKDYKANQSYEAKIAKLEAKQDKYTELFATKTDQWNKILEQLADPVISISKALKNIENNATKDMKGDINALNKILKPLGYSISTKKLYDEGGILTGLGGIKATTRDETVLPPDITEKLLKPLHPAGFRQRMEELRYLYGANGSTMIGGYNNSIGSQHNGDLYTFGNVTLTETQARQTTMYDFVQAAKGLRSYSGRM